MSASTYRIRYRLRDALIILLFQPAKAKLIDARFSPAATADVESTLRLKCQDASSAVLRARQADGTVLLDSEVAPNGIVKLTPLSASPILCRLILEPKRSLFAPQDPTEIEWTVTPRVIKPKFISISVPSKAKAGEQITLSWNAPAAESVWWTIDDGMPVQHSGAAEDVITLRPIKAGIIVLRGDARNKHAKASVVRTITVEQPAPTINVNDKLLCGRPGTEVILSWSITDADAVFLQGRGERHQVGLTGSVGVTLGDATETLLLTAKGPGGTSSLTITAVPRIISSLD